MAELDIDIQSFDIPRLVTVYPDRAGVRWWTKAWFNNREEGETSVEIEREQAIRFMQDNIEKDAWLEEFFPRQMEVYHNAIEQTKEQLLKQINMGYEGNINYELLLSLDPDLVLLYGVNGASSMEGKLKELNIPFMYVGDYLEESPLGKAEWLVALAEVAGKRTEGEKVFAHIPVRYNALKKRVTDAAIDAPSVMLNTPYGDNWFMPSTESYVARLIKDAGGDYIYKKNTGNASAPIDLEEAYLLASQVDMWLHVGMANTLDELRAACPKFTDTRCFRNGYVYNNNARTNAAGGNDYYESAVVNPDLVLRDLVKIFHPELVAEDFVYYKQLK